MSQDSAPPGEMSDEMSVVIKALREADLRLEELTAGEVDTVLDREGRPFLLQRAQHQLRDTEAAKRLAILNALPAQIALLDGQGRIVVVNERWEQPAGGGSLRGPDFRIGLNYAQLCDRGREPWSVDAQRVAAGVRSVLTGATDHFSAEYPSGLATERRWFLLTITPLTMTVLAAPL
jgi:PAS domain-containing protein